MNNKLIDYEDAWFDLLDRLKTLHNEAGDLELEPAHSIYHMILDDIIPSVLEKQISVNMYSK